MTHVDLVFPARGRTIPIDHGYALYAALSHTLPVLHESQWVAVHPVGGRPLGRLSLALTRGSAVTLRIPVEHIGTVLPLAGKILQIHETPVMLGTPNVRPLQPSSSLDARIVVIKLTNVPQTAEGKLDLDGISARFSAELRRQLDALGVARPFELKGRRWITIKGRRVLGYSTRVLELQPDESLRLQVQGVGGRHAMGAGLFRPTRGAPT